MTSKTIFKTEEYGNNAIYCHKYCGPAFGEGGLKLGKEPMNGEGHGSCDVLNYHDRRYDIQEDAQGNSPVTGDGGNKGEKHKNFTCVELEVYHLIF